MYPKLWVLLYLSSCIELFGPPSHSNNKNEFLLHIWCCFPETGTSWFCELLAVQHGGSCLCHTHPTWASPKEILRSKCCIWKFPHFRSKTKCLHLCRNLSFLNAYHWLLCNILFFFLCVYELHVLWYMLVIFMVSLKYQFYTGTLYYCFPQQCLLKKQM